jgi:dihydrodipicolinate synthase/N-acetylneuraminate lyase
MKTTRVTPPDIASSVFAVPPLARRDDLSLHPEAQQKLVRHIEAGGVTTVLYGGNANLYNMRISEYAEFLALIERTAGERTWVIPSAGPDFGRLMDQASLLRGARFPAVMILPLAFPSMPGGVARGLRLFSDACDKQLVLYLKSEQQLRIEDVAALAAEGRVCAIKYAIPRAQPTDDAFLDRLLREVDPAIVACGLAEKPSLTHLLQYRLASYTSGGVCIAPRLSTRLLRCAQAGDQAGAQQAREAFLPLESLRERAQVFAVLHEAITLSGIAEMGPLLPMLDFIDERDRSPLRSIVRDLVAAEAAQS